ncbi:alanine--tRNA ligase [Fulvivirgaceae bacterium LMO-SS25]
MESKIIRQKYIEFFKSKEHSYVPSSPLVVQNDPTLMFTNAGMNQFKDYFLGNKVAPWPRVANSQKCLRVSGKHNDLEDVGMDTYHHTMFEMLGNWSFGDYFKKEAIQWAWELLTEVYQLPKDRMYASVFEGDKDDNLAFDQEAFDLWNEIIPAERIIYGSKKDNFWEMGDTGPCGPCSEIHIDLRPQSEVDKVPGRDLVNNDHPQVVEIWNLVFMQFNRMADGSLKPLPAQHVDTGMGFERLCMAIQQKTSNYDTDVFTPLIEAISAEAGVKYGADTKTDIAIRVIVDHIRAISFTIADGQLPSNNKAGYVIRRILRRAVRYGYTFLNFRDPFLFRLLPILADQFDGVFPELKSQQDFIARVIMEEEISFLRTLENGLKSFQQIKENLKSTTIPGSQIFELYDTFGFPYDLTALLARENNLQLDEAGFKKELESQKSRSRKAAEQEKSDWMIVSDETDVEFVGYDNTEASAKLLRYREIKEKGGTYYQLVLDKTPFYAESGGQVGDSGRLICGDETIEVFDTKKENDLIIQFTKKLPSNLEADFLCQIDVEKRNRTRNNHSATHLLHAALREVLGNHVQQKGSLVNSEILRFDFSHFSKVEESEIQRIEDIVNRKIRENIALDEKRNVPIEDAKALGATALFGEKYGEFVRVITFGQDFSVELCGGTHTPATGNIGYFKIVSESSVAAGVRRIEALTSEGAELYMREKEAILNEVQQILKAPKDITKALQQLLDDRSNLQKELEKLHLDKASGMKDELKQKLFAHSGMNVIVEQVNLPNADALKKIAYELKNEVENLMLILAAEIDKKPMIAVMIADNLVTEKGLDAGKMVRELAKNIQGGGGGQPFFATAGGKNLAGLPKVIEAAQSMIKEIL